MLLLFQIVVLLYSVVIHEVSHGLAAQAMGDHTAEHAGRLTLNPLKHLDMFGSFLLPLLLVVARAPFLFGYAKPVPYNPDNLSDRVYGPAKVAVAGPASNLALALIFGLVLRAMIAGGYGGLFLDLFSYIVALNLVLAVFNLIPIPPLDGHWLLMTFLPARWYGLRLALYRYSMPFLLVFIVFIFPLLSPVIAKLYILITGQPWQ